MGAECLTLNVHAKVTKFVANSSCTWVVAPLLAVVCVKLSVCKYGRSRIDVMAVDSQDKSVQMAFYEIVLKKESNNIHVSEGKDRDTCNDE